MTGALYRLGRLCVAHKVVVVVIWAVLLVGGLALAHLLSNETSDNLTLPGTDSQAATDTLSNSFPQQANGTSPLVLKTKSGSLADGDNADALNSTVANLKKVEHVSTVTSPLDPNGKTQLSQNGQIGYISVGLDVVNGDITEEIANDVLGAADPATKQGMEAKIGGSIGQKLSKPETESSEAAGLGTAMIILALTLGTLVAMGLPIFAALVALIISLGLVNGLSHLVDVPTVGPTLATMIGLGVGIDYALFLVYRERELRAEGLEIQESIARSIATTGGAILVAGGTVIVALVSLLVAQIPLVTALGYASAIAVVVAVCGALTLVPAVLALLGHRIDSLRLPKFLRFPPKEPKDTMWGKLARLVARHPVLSIVVALAILIPLSIPTFSMVLGQQDNNAMPEGTQTKDSYDLITEGFGAGTNGPLLIAVTLDPAAKPASDASDSSNPAAQSDPRVTDPRLTTLQSDLTKTNDVKLVTGPSLNQAGTAAIYNVIPDSAPSDQATTDLVTDIRDNVVPAATKGGGIEVDVGGTTAGYDDLAEEITEKLPLVIGVVVLLSCIMLLLAFRSIAIPLKAAAMNLISIVASYGVLTAVFQYGWGAELIGLPGAVPVVAFVPLMMFAVLFGLSMDYEVFLMSHIKEHHDRGESDKASVVGGLTTSAKVITSAACIMCAVFASFILNGDPTVKQFGVGLTIAVALDATIVRCLLVPGVLIVLRKWAWWMPRWMDRALPKIDIEGEGYFEELERKRAAAASERESAGAVAG